MFFQLLSSWPAYNIHIPLPSFLSLKLKMQSHLWTIWFLIYSFPPLHWWALSFFCQANSLAPVCLSYVNTLFLFGHSLRLLYLLKLNTRDCLNFIFFISPGNILYLYSCSSSFCCSREHLMTLAKYRLISYFSVLCRSFPWWMVRACLGMFLCPVRNLLTWGQTPPKGSRGIPAVLPRDRSPRWAQWSAWPPPVVHFCSTPLSMGNTFQGLVHPWNEWVHARKPLALPQPATVTAQQGCAGEVDL